MASELVRQLVREIRDSGGHIPFSHFMGQALYAEGVGYYEQPRRVGREGDFVTSVSVGPLLGELLAEYAMETLAGHRGTRVLVEAGADDGRLAADILSAWHERDPVDFRSCQYLILEPSERRRDVQRSMLAPFEGRVHWVNDPVAAQGWFSGGIVESPGAIFVANELFDAFPVDVFQWSSSLRRWIPRQVGWTGSEFEWVDADVGIGVEVPEVPEELAQWLPDRFQTEVSTDALQYWESLARIPEIRALLTLDYGFGAGERYLPHRADGTLRGYRNQRVTHGVLEFPGEQDLTAHVDFEGLIRRAEAVGRTTRSFESQERWVTRRFQRMAEVRGTGWLNVQRIRQFQMLSRPDFLGRSFRVLDQR